MKQLTKKVTQQLFDFIKGRGIKFYDIQIEVVGHTKEETQELFDLIERHAIKYYDVQIEIVDHYASAI